MTTINGITPRETAPTADGISNRAFYKILASLGAVVVIAILGTLIFVSNGITAAQHDNVKYYVRTSVLMLNDNLFAGKSIKYFAGLETLHGDHQTLRTRTVIDGTHYIVTSTDPHDGYTVSYDSWHADYVTHN